MTHRLLEQISSSSLASSLSQAESLSEGLSSHLVSCLFPRALSDRASVLTQRGMRSLITREEGKASAATHTDTDRASRHGMTRCSQF